MKKFFFLILSLFVINQLNCMTTDQSLSQIKVHSSEVEIWSKLPAEIKLLIFNAYFKPLIKSIASQISLTQLNNKTVRYKLPLVLTSSEFRDFVYLIFNEKTIQSLVNTDTIKMELLFLTRKVTWKGIIPQSFYQLGKAMLDKESFKRFNTSYQNMSNELGKELVKLLKSLSTFTNDMQNNIDYQSLNNQIDSLIFSGSNIDYDEGSALIVAIEKGYFWIANTLLLAKINTKMDRKIIYKSIKKGAHNNILLLNQNKEELVNFNLMQDLIYAHLPLRDKFRMDRLAHCFIIVSGTIILVSILLS